MKWFRCIVFGKVQHVFYRKFVSQAMMRAGFKGYVRNLDDGTVEVVFFVYDEEEELPLAHRIIEEGSPMSEVERFECEEIDEVEHHGDGFVVRH